MSLLRRLRPPIAALAPKLPLSTTAESTSSESSSSWTLKAITAALMGVGPIHFIVPSLFDKIVPPILPFSARFWTYASGIVEIALGALLLYPRTRRIGGLAAASLFVAVYPANVQMAKDLTGKGLLAETIAFGRLPLQFPLIYGALKIARDGK